MKGLRGADRHFYGRVFALVAAGIVGFLTLRILGPVVQPLCWALVFAVLLAPAQQRLTVRLGNRRTLAAAVLTATVLVVVAGPVTGLSGVMASEMGDLVASARKQSPQGGLKIPELAQVPVAGQPLDELRKDLGVSRSSVRGWLNGFFDTGLEAVGPLTGRLFMGVLGTMTAFAFMLVLLFLTLRDGSRLLQRTDELIPWPKPVKDKLITDLCDVLRAIVFGTTVTAILQGILVGVAFAVVGLPAPVLFGSLAAVLAMLPVGGTAFVWGPGVVALAMQDRWGAASALALWGALLVGTMDNLLQPYLVAHRARIGTLTIFLGVIGGLAAFGVIGLILGPLILVLATELLQLLREPAPASLAE
ncbi:MAG: AI-2E family transporter [Gammaproteobacteria bacterium]